MKKKLRFLVVLAFAITIILSFSISMLSFGLVGASAEESSTTQNYYVKLFVDDKEVTSVSANSSTAYVFTWDLYDGTDCKNSNSVASFPVVDATGKVLYNTDVYFCIRKVGTTGFEELGSWQLNKSATAEAGEYQIYAYKSYSDYQADTEKTNPIAGKGYIFNFTRNASSCGSNSNVTTYVIMGVLVAAVIGFCVWNMINNKKKQKKQAETVSKIMVGDKVKTIGGICGFITELNDADNTFTMVTEGTNGTKCEIKLDKAAIYQTAPVAPRPTTPAPETPVAPATEETPKAEEPKVEEAKVEEPKAEKTAKKSTKKAPKDGE